MMDQNIKDFWGKEQLKGIQEFKFNLEKYFESRKNIWQHLTIVVSTILGFSLGLTTTTKEKVNLFLLITWILQIISILIGFFLIIIDSESRHKRDISSFKFGYNMSEISKMEMDGKFIGNEELKAGLVLSAIDKYNRELWKPVEFSKEGLDLIKKYQTKLPSERFFKGKLKKNILQKILENVVKWANINVLILSSIFYLIIICSFIFILLSILIR